MAVPYQVIPCTNPVGVEGTDYACNRATKSGDYDFAALAEDIQFSTTLTKADIVAVLTAAKEYIKKGLLAGQRIVLNELGALKVGIRSKCFEQSLLSEDNFDASSYIKGFRIAFRPDAELLRYVRSEAKVKRVASELLA